MGPLAKLPVFLNLDRRRVVIAGGSAAAAWKAELIASAGAEVDIYAADPTDEMQRIAEAGCGPGTLSLHRRDLSLIHI